MRRGNNPIDISERDEESDNLQAKASFFLLHSNNFFNFENTQNVKIFKY